MKASVKHALMLLDRRSFASVEDYRKSRAMNREWVNRGRNPYGDDIGDISFDKKGVTDYWSENDHGVIQHLLFTVDKDGEVIVEELEIREDEL